MAVQLEYISLYLQVQIQREARASWPLSLFPRRKFLDMCPCMFWRYICWRKFRVKIQLHHSRKVCVELVWSVFITLVTCLSEDRDLRRDFIHLPIDYIIISFQMIPSQQFTSLSLSQCLEDNTHIYVIVKAKK